MRGKGKSVESKKVVSTSKQTSLKDMFGGKGNKKDKTGTPATKSSSLIHSNSLLPISADKLAHLKILNVTYGLGEEHKKDPIATHEGRVVTLEFTSFILVNCYVPNSVSYTFWFVLFL